MTKKFVCLCAAFGCIFTIAGSVIAISEIRSANQPQPLSSTADSVVTIDSRISSSAVQSSSVASVISSNKVTESVPVKQESSAPINTKFDKHYFDNALFIGDSRTEGLMVCPNLANSTFYTQKGLMVSTILTKPIVQTSGSNITVPNALRKNHFSKIFIMLGVNELGWSYADVFIQKYEKVIDVLKETQPKAEIYVQAILPVSAAKSEKDKTYNNGRIKIFNGLIKKMTENKKVNYIDASPAVTDKNGCLAPEGTVDGVHLNSKYSQKWCDFLQINTSKNK